MTKEFRTTDADATNSRMAKMGLNATFKNLVTNVELNQATLLIVAQLKMSLAMHVRRKAISQKFANLPNEFKVLMTAPVKMKSL